MVRRLTYGFIVLAGVIASCRLCHSQTKTKASVAPIDIQATLSWLPADTETLIVADVAGRSFLTPGDLKALDKDDDKNPVLSTRQIAAMFQSIPLSFIGLKRSLAQLLGKHRISLAVEGSRHFRGPKDLGEMPYEGCAIVLFADDLGDSAGLFMKRADIKKQTVEGFAVAVFQERLEEDLWTFLVAFPRQNVLLVATNREYMQQVLARMKMAPSDRALPASLPEWKYVDRHAPFWGLRHYDRSQANLDPSSPFGGQKSANMPDEQAIGLTFYYDPSKGRAATITYLSGDKNAVKKLKAYIPSAEDDARELHAQFRELDPGVVDSSYELLKKSSVGYFLFLLGGLLGHAVFL